VPSLGACTSCAVHVTHLPDPMTTPAAPVPAPRGTRRCATSAVAWRCAALGRARDNESEAVQQFVFATVGAGTPAARTRVYQAQQYVYRRESFKLRMLNGVVGGAQGGKTLLRLHSLRGSSADGQHLPARAKTSATPVRSNSKVRRWNRASLTFRVVTARFVFVSFNVPHWQGAPSSHTTLMAVNGVLSRPTDEGAGVGHAS
jgi:hypothetical protein